MSQTKLPPIDSRKIHQDEAVEFNNQVDRVNNVPEIDVDASELDSKFSKESKDSSYSGSSTDSEKDDTLKALQDPIFETQAQFTAGNKRRASDMSCFLKAPALKLSQFNKSKSEAANKCKSSKNIIKDIETAVNEEVEHANKILWAFRKKALDNMVSNYRPSLQVQSTEQEEVVVVKEPLKKKCLFRGGDGFRVRWDLLIMSLALYSCFIVPIQFAFEPEFTKKLYFIIPDLFVNVIFAVDIFINFRTTYVHPKTGKEVTNLWEIGVTYLKLRFWIDFLATIPFDTAAELIIQDSNSSVLQLFSLLKLVRVLRLGKLIAIMKVKDDIKLSLRLIKLIFFLMIYLHCLGCSWYYIVDDDQNWMPPLDYVWVKTDFYEKNWMYQYVMGVYHAVLMFTGNDIGPRGSYQILFVSFFVMMGAIINANLFGQLAVILSSMNRKASLFQEKFDITTTTMKNLNLPEALQTKVTGFLTYTEKFLDSQNELKSFLDIISPSLRQEVIQYIFSETLKNNATVNFDPSLIDYLTKKLQTKIHMPEDQIISQGEVGKHIFFIARGECEVSVTDHNNISQVTSIIKPGDLFGEVALLCGCRRTASVKTTNYSTLACIDKPTFKDMCQQYEEFIDKLKLNLKNYQDKLKMFLKVSLRYIPFFRDLSDDTIEEMSYHLKQKYYDPNDVIFRAGESVDTFYLVTRGEVDLSLNIDNHDFVVHNLYQGCFLGGYKVLEDCTHAHTARAVNNVALHCLGKDSISLLSRNFKDFALTIENARKYIKITQDPIIGFGLFRDPMGDLTPIRLFKMAVVKILKINRDLKQAGSKVNASGILERMGINYFSIDTHSRRPESFQRQSLKIMERLTDKVESLEGYIRRLEGRMINDSKEKRRQSHQILNKLNSDYGSIKEIQARGLLEQRKSAIYQNNPISTYMSIPEDSKISENSGESYSSSDEDKMSPPVRPPGLLNKEASENQSVGILFMKQLNDQKENGNKPMNNQ